MSKTKEKAPHWPQHKMGKQCGYHEYEDGSITIADSHANLMQAALTEQQGLDLYVEAVNSHLAKLYERVATLRQNFWKNVREDYSLDFDNHEFSYNHHSKRITKVPKPEPKAKA